jgi:hypothetical protein
MKTGELSFGEMQKREEEEAYKENSGRGKYGPEGEARAS